MKTTTINKIVNTILLAGLCELGIVAVPPMIDRVLADESANAAIGNASAIRVIHNMCFISLLKMARRHYK